MEPQGLIVNVDVVKHLCNSSGVCVSLWLCERNVFLELHLLGSLKGVYSF